MKNNEPLNTQNAANSSDRSTLSHKAGDQIEKVGQKISDMGAQKIGDAVSRAGDKLEHSQDNKPRK